MPTLEEIINRNANKDRQRRSVLIYIPGASPVRIWGGVFDLKLPDDDVWDAGGLYKGRGELIDFPRLGQLVNGTAERLSITLSGVSQSARAYVNDPAKSLYDRMIHLGVVWFDNDFQIIGTQWMWTGRIGPVSSSWNGHVATISISAVTSRARRKRGGTRFWNNTNHRLRHPTDGMAKRTMLYSISRQVRWP